VQDLLDALPFSLTAGDPGEVPWIPDEPVCDGSHDWCLCGEPPAVDALPPADSEFWATPGVTPAAAGPSPLLGELRGVLDRLEAHGPVSGSAADTAELLALAERARGLGLRELAEMDVVGGHLRPGQSSTTASWLRDQQNLTDSAARGAVRLATALRDDLPAVGELLTAGEITVEHAHAVIAGVRGLDREIVREAQDGLCALAQVADPADLRKRLRDKAAAINDKIAAEAERRARERMGLTLNDVGPHTAVDGTLVGDEGATVRLAMDLAIEAARTAGDTRGKAARRADVLVTWARDYLARHHGPGDSTADDLHTVRTQLHIICTPDQLTNTGITPTPAAGTDAEADAAHAGQTSPFTGCSDPVRPALAELLDRDPTGQSPAAPAIAGEQSPLSRNALRRLACDATVDLVVLQPGTPDPLYVGRAARIVTACQWRALVVRDRRCVVKGCRRPPAQCVAHHVRHWADGGLTDLNNLVLLCHQHHHDHHDRQQDLPHHDGTRWLTQTGWAQAPPW
jgi:hypothetical protein